MTTKEMYIEFLRLLETVDKTVLIKDLPSSDMVLQMLNVAQLRYLKEVYFGDGNHELILEKADTLPNLIRREIVDSALIESGPLANIGNSIDLNNITPSDFDIASVTDGEVNITIGGVFNNVRNTNYRIEIDGVITKDITNIVDYDSTVTGTIQITSDQHGLSTGDTIRISNTTNYNKTYIITSIDANNFYITATYIADEISGTWELSPNTFKWSDNGGVSWNESGINVSTSPVPLNNGLTVTFNNTVGAVVGDHWGFIAVKRLDAKFLFYIRSDSLVTRLETNATDGEKWIPNEYIKYSDRDKYLTTPFNNPIIIKPGCYIENDGVVDKLIIVYDRYTTITLEKGINIEYIKIPGVVTFDTDSELPSFLHEEIVKLAVDLYVNYYKFRLSGLAQSKKQ